MTTEVQWRRRWKPTLSASPWQPVEIDGENYLLKTRFLVDSYEILVTDSTSFWYEELSDDAIKRRIQKLNPSIEAPLTRILDQIKSNLETPGKGTSRAVAFKPDPDTGGQKMMLTITSQLAGMPFTWNFLAKPAEPNMGRDHLIEPLKAMVAEMGRRQQELVKLIQSKDKEIDDYKSQGAKASRKHIETAPFLETVFENEMLVSKSFEEQLKKMGSTAFDTPGQDLYRQIMCKHAWVNRSPSKDDTDSLTDDASLDSRRRTATGTSWGTNRLPPSLAASKSPAGSPTKSPAKSPRSSGSTPDKSPTKDSELLRRQALERRLENEEIKKQEKSKKKKKIAF